jgi:hypothetical protein
VIYTPQYKYDDRLSVFENKVLRRIFGLKRDDVTGGQEKTV